MPWIVGIDEAGYGPNLGPFVMASTACRIPEKLAQSSLWKFLKAAVRRPRQPDDGRLLIEDSKIVYTAKKGLKRLERGVLATLLSPQELEPLQNGNGVPFTLANWVQRISSAATPQLIDEFWFTGATPLPVCADCQELFHVAQRFHSACDNRSLTWAAAQAVVVCPPRFNAVMERADSKSIILSLSLAEVLRLHFQQGWPDEAVEVFVDKHGGRNNYAVILQSAFPEGTVRSLEETEARSRYQIEGLPCALRLTFAPRSDCNQLPVALASMLAKYLRELFMLEFNQFWQQHLPELKPTAGYPVDAARFMREIRPTAQKLGLDEKSIWRRK